MSEFPIRIVSLFGKLTAGEETDLSKSEHFPLHVTLKKILLTKEEWRSRDKLTELAGQINSKATGIREEMVSPERESVHFCCSDSINAFNFCIRICATPFLGGGS